MQTALVISAFLMGIAGSLHCVGMCGPLVMGMPFHNAQNKPLAIGFYHLGKATAYGLLGALFGLFGKAIALMNLQQMLSVVAGLTIIFFAFLPQLLHRLSGNFIFKTPMGKLLQQVQQTPTLPHFAGIGFLNGFLPCGLIYTALAAATVTTNPANGFLFMFIFGMGTLPALSALAFFKKKMSASFRQSLGKLSLVVSLLVGTLLIARGLNLGIPYVSPHIEKTGEVKACCSNSAHHTDTINCH